MRTLGLDPNSKGIGFTVLEDGNKLIDWGVKYPRLKNNKKYLQVIENLMDYYNPDIVAIESAEKLDKRRSPRTRHLLRKIELLALKRKIVCKSFSKLKLQSAFKEKGTLTKQKIATFLARMFPETSSYLPPKRKAWMTEDARISLFMALGFCLLAGKGI